MACLYPQASPLPEISWLRDGEPLPSWISMINTEGSSQLVIPMAKRSDSGIYTIKAKNSVGQASFDVEVRVTGEFWSSAGERFHELGFTDHCTRSNFPNAHCKYSNVLFGCNWVCSPSKNVKINYILLEFYVPIGYLPSDTHLNFLRHFSCLYFRALVKQHPWPWPCLWPGFRRTQASGPSRTGAERPRESHHQLGGLSRPAGGRPSVLRGGATRLQHARLEDRGRPPLRHQLHGREHRVRARVPLPRIRQERHRPFRALRVPDLGNKQPQTCAYSAF